MIKGAKIRDALAEMTSKEEEDIFKRMPFETIPTDEPGIFIIESRPIPKERKHKTKKKLYVLDGEDFSQALKILDTFLASGRLGGIIFKKSKTKHEAARTVEFCIDLEKEEYGQLKEFVQTSDIRCEGYEE